MSLNYELGTGANDYVVALIAPPPPSGKTKSDFTLPHLQVLNCDNALPTTGMNVNVPSGAPYLVAGFQDVNGVSPDNVIITVTKPDGTVLNQPESLSNSNIGVSIVNGSLSALIVQSPDSGTWNITVVNNNPDPTYEFSFFFSTIPTADVQTTLDNTLSSMSSAEALAKSPVLSDSWGCFWCKTGVVALSIIILSAILIGVSVLTEGSAPVAALVSFINVATVTPAVALSIIKGLAAATSLTITAVMSSVCMWAGACTA